MLFLKCLPPTLLAHGNFKWPSQVGNIVESETWDPRPVCGGGLHWLINGNGYSDLLEVAPDPVWIAFESVDKHGNPSNAEAVAIDDEKGKCHRAIIRAIGSRKTATDWLMARGCTGVHYAVDAAHGYGRNAATVGDYGVALVDRQATATSGDLGISAAGDHGTAITGHAGIAQSGARGTATAGQAGVSITGFEGEATSDDGGIALAGNYGKATVGVCGLARAQDSGTAEAGQYGAAIAGYNGTAIAGANATAIAGYLGHASTKENGVAIAGADGTVMGGMDSVLIIHNCKKKPVVAIVGQDGIEPNTPYRLNDNEDQLVKRTPEEKENACCS